MTISDVINKLGGTKAVARAVGVRPTSVRSWCFNSAIPEKHHATLLRMEAATTYSITKAILESAQ